MVSTKVVIRLVLRRGGRFFLRSLLQGHAASS